MEIQTTIARIALINAVHATIAVTVLHVILLLNLNIHLCSITGATLSAQMASTLLLINA